ncbi:GNAT family N-acetyltransferase [Bacillus marasmi]|uniref:GNAT family N-acetyltransferase n=1 Tax=Bacillus marasmi TaxID=1926279 RepID=UPI0011CAFCED|nr:GNAT family N-acetyltransferase [Bacillus marasmi]
MIRRLTNYDHSICLKLLTEKCAENLFIIGDIEIYGYDQDFQKLWGDFNEKGKLIAVLLKYEENYIPFAVEPFDALSFAKIMMNDPEFKMMSGLREITEKIEVYITKSLISKRQTYYSKCTYLKEGDEVVDVTDVKAATVQDAPALVQMINSVPEFGNSSLTLARKLREMNDGTSRSVFIEVDGKIVSTASTAAENSLSAMVVAVATLNDYKKLGFATKCMVQLCRTLLQEGKEVCLFYDNPAAGNIYKRIGFEDIGFWMMYSYE